MKIRKKTTDLTQYLQNISQYPLLTARQEKILALRMAKGCVKSRERLINANLRLVVKIAQSQPRRGLPLVDAVHEGNLGLIHAAELFHPEAGTKFSTYATHWIKQSIRAGVRRATYMIQVPGYLFPMTNKLVGHGLDDVDNFDADKVSKVLETTEQNIEQSRMALIAMRLNPVDEAGQSKGVNDDSLEELMKRDETEYVLQFLDRLTPREQEVIKMRFGIGGKDADTLRGIGRKLGISRECVRSIETEALSNLRKNLAGV